MSLLLTKLNPFKEFKELEQRFQEIQPHLDLSDVNVTSFSPTVNTREDDTHYYIEVDLPGVQKEDIHVETKDNKLTITGERKTKKEVKEKDYYRMESSYGKFQRTFTLPENADAETIQAKNQDGVLEIKISKTNKTENSKKIQIT